ncbi:MAG: O-antigen polymerase [Dehalococcoidia bacterium]
MSSQFIPPVAFLWALALVARLAFGSWLAPGALAALAWAIFVTVSAAIPDYQWMPTGGLWWIGISILVFCIGCWLALLVIRRPKAGNAPPPKEAFQALEPVLWVLMALAVLFQVLLFFVLPPETSDRSLPFRLLHGAPYASALIGGCLFACAVSLRQRAGALLPIFIGLAFSALGSGRSISAITTVYWLLGYVYIQVLVGQRGLGIPWARMVAVLVLAVLTILGASLATRQRYARAEYPYAQSRVDILTTVWREEGLGGILAKSWLHISTQARSGAFTFTVWFHEAWAEPPSLALGRYLFGGTVRLLRGRWGTYTDLPARYENIEVAPGVFTNTGTHFKPLVLDFGFAGSLAYMFFLGLVAGWAYRQVERGSAVGLAVVVAVAVYFLLSLSPFSYNSLTQAYLILAGALWWAKRRWERIGSRVQRPEVAPASALVSPHV